jgi:hypothetical protein
MPISLRPDYTAATGNHARSFWRAWTARALGTIHGENPEQIIKRAWGADESALLISRAVPATASTTASGWGSDLLAVAATGTLPILAPASAAAALFARCLQLDFTGVHQTMVPRVQTAPTATWTAEGAPSAMLQPVLASVVCGPLRKVLFGTAVSIELENFAPDTAVAVIKATVIQAATDAVDRALLDATAADLTRPAGLLNGVSDLGATPAGADNLTALTTDLAKLAGAFADAGIAADDACLFMNPRQSVIAKALLVGPLDQLTITGTPAVPAGTVVAVAPTAIGMAFALPELEVSRDGLVHMDTVPRDIDTIAVSQTVKSAWQAGLLLLKIRLHTTWSPLAPAAVQKITGTTW